MNLVFVDQEKNIKNVVALYRKKNKAEVKIIAIKEKNVIFCLTENFCKNNSNLFSRWDKLLNSSGLLTKPFLLPMLKNFVFLWLKISSFVIPLKEFKISEIEASLDNDRSDSEINFESVW